MQRRAWGWLSALAAIVLVVFGVSRFTQWGSSDRPIVAITQIATHPALDEVRAGLIAGLESRGFSDGAEITILFKNANGDPSLSLPIAESFVRRSPAVIVPISTPSTLAVVKSTNKVPIVFSGVTDPVGVGLVPYLDKPPGGNVTGVSDRWPFKAQVTAFRSVFPTANRIGMMFTQGDDVSRIGVEAMSELASILGFELVLSPVTAAQDVYPSAVSLLRDVDAIYTGIDHLLLENMDSLVKAAREADKPIFGGESGSVEKGAVMALSINMKEFGDLTAELVAQVLNGRNPGDIPIKVVSSGDLLVNKAVAEHFGLDLDDLKAKGAILVD